MNSGELHEFLQRLKGEKSRGSKVVDQHMIDHFQSHLNRLLRLEAELELQKLLSNISLN